MSNGDLELQMPSNLRAEREASSSQPFLNPRPVLPIDVTPKRRGVLCLTVETPVASSFQRPVQARPPPRWRTPEFLFYGVVFAAVLPLMIWKPMVLSRDTHPNYYLYQERLSDGWIFGRKIDDSDAQYRSFRDNLPVLVPVAGFFLLLKYVYLQVFQRTSSATQGTLLNRIPLQFIFSVLFLLGLHGANILKILFILSLNYVIAKSLHKSRMAPVLTWIFNISVLFAIDRNSGYRFASLSPSLTYLDSVQGVYPRWYIPFNITMLRLVSFNMDYFWSCRAASLPPARPENEMNHKQRTATSHNFEVYSFVNFVAYVLYPPLYIAGPIMTFNDFMWQHVKSTSIPSWPMVIKYLVRFLACLLVMEFVLHYMYVVAIKDSAAWTGDTSFELSMIGWWNLIVVWLKLLLPWRFFRLWALIDGIDPPENMIRCMVNNYSALGFWRAWHRSYNLWIVRYIYIPLGGTKRQLVSTALIFSFVALWHDLTFRLLAWGWLISLFIVPEIAAQYLLPPAKYGSRTWYRHACALGAVVNMLMMMIANLVGFVFGVDGTKYMIQQLFGSMQGRELGNLTI
ncbi:MBOAT-domain-containing protein [Phellopilus nigrolimitatus]|nr:MBOAT-domain-containing protein [Phellopilus nigrolimitatus]